MLSLYVPAAAVVAVGTILDNIIFKKNLLLNLLMGCSVYVFKFMGCVKVWILRGGFDGTEVNEEVYEKKVTLKLQLFTFLP